MSEEKIHLIEQVKRMQAVLAAAKKLKKVEKGKPVKEEGKET